VLSAPLWHLRQRHEGIQLTEFEQSVAQQWELLTRLQLLKAIRDVHRNLLLTEAEVEISRANAKAYQSLLEDVERRVLAGDLAPADKLAAQSSVLEALSKIKESEQVLQNHSNAWFQLTGSHERPEVENFHQQPVLRLDQHIAWQYSQAQIALAERSLAFISEFRQEKPIASVGLRQEKSASNSHQSIMASITVPIGGESKQRILITEARAQRDLRVGEHLRLERQLHAEFERTVRNAENAKDLLAIEQERATVLYQRSTLVEKAFAAGEASLPTLLLALSQTRAAQTQVSRRAVELRLSMAQMSQAAGVLP
jgi:cobalt-zinc-cadmium efflux system outer membrane protein